jgi:hypothetical protein
MTASMSSGEATRSNRSTGGKRLGTIRTVDRHRNRLTGVPPDP